MTEPYWWLAGAWTLCALIAMWDMIKYFEPIAEDAFDAIATMFLSIAVFCFWPLWVIQRLYDKRKNR